MKNQTINNIIQNPEEYIQKLEEYIQKLEEHIQWQNEKLQVAERQIGLMQKLKDNWTQRYWTMKESRDEWRSFYLQEIQQKNKA